MKSVYLDYAASTPLDPQVLSAMHDCLQMEYGNPSSVHHKGQSAANLITQARQTVADIFQVKPQEIIWTSGATESNNLAIKGVALSHPVGKHIITSQIEHESVMDSCTMLSKQGYEITYLKPDTNGVINIADIVDSIRKETILISIMYVNNEIGAIQDIAKIAEIAQQNKILLHVDAVQAAGKIPINLAKLPIDLLSMSAHKIYGPKGVGALFVRENLRSRLQAQLHGGGQEYQLRPGTLATHQIVGLAKALEIARNQMDADQQHIRMLRERFLAGLKKIGDVQINGAEYSMPGIISIAFKNIPATRLLAAMKEIAVSTGSACHATSREPSRVLRAIGVTNDIASATLRFSWGRFTSEEEIDYTLEKLQTVVSVLR